MASDENANALVALLASPAVRNASLTILAAVGIALSVRSLVSAPSPPPPSSLSSSPRVTAQNLGHLDHNERSEQTAAAEKRETASRSPPTPRDMEESEERYLSHRRRHERSLSSSTAGGGGGTSKISIAIFWDVDNCQPNSGASGHEVAQAIRRATQSIGPDAARLSSIVSFKAYLELSSETSTPNAAQVQLRSELQGSGVSLIDTPKSGRKDVADKMMIADLLAYAIDKRPPALIVLLSGDRDFAYPLGILRNRGYEILLITPPVGATPILEASANYKLRWRQDVLGIEYDAQGRPYDRSKTAAAAAIVRTPSTSAFTSQGPVGSLPSSLKAKQAPSVPPVFMPLVKILTQMHREGQSHPLRSGVALRLISVDPLIYDRAYARGWGEYVAIAEAAGIVKLGQGQRLGREWISLKDAPRETRAEVHLPPVSILKSPAAIAAAAATVATANAESPANVASTPIGNDINTFFLLIEAHNALKSSLPAGQDPTTRDLGVVIDDITKTMIADPHQQLRLPSYDLYIKQAFRARVARLKTPENGEAGTVVQLNKRYAGMATGFVLPSSSTEVIKKLADAAQEAAANEHAPSSESQTLNGKQADVIEESDAVQTSNAGPSGWTTIVPARKSKTATASDNKKANGADTKSTTNLCYPHQPSGEVIHTTYFPLANFLLDQRAAGLFNSPEAQVYMSVSKHHKLGKSIHSMKDFYEYLAKAVADDIVNVIKVEGKSYIGLHERLSKGEGDGKHRGFRHGHNSARSDDQPTTHSSPKKAHAAKSSEATQEAADTIAPTAAAPEIGPDSVNSEDDIFKPAQPSTRFGTVSPTPQDRQKLKHLVEAMVSIRKRMEERVGKIVDSEEDRISMLRLGIEPLRSTVISTLLQIASRPGSGGDSPLTAAPAVPSLPPGTWLQGHGYTGFGELFDDAERKGFIHLLFHADGRDRVRLAQKYEDMFFS